MERLNRLKSGRRPALVAAGFLLLASAFLLLIRIVFFTPLQNLSDPVVFEVRPGSSLSGISEQLVEKGILDSGTAFSLAARWQGVASSIKAGEYRAEPGMNIRDLLALVVSGESIQYRVTFVEGWTMKQVLATMAAKEEIEQTLEDSTLADIAVALGVPQSNPEGLIHPDTYFFTRGTADMELLRMARTRQQLLLDAAWESRLGALPYDDPYQALVMASIIEKESAVGSERGHIAGVFARRLERGMRLQSDPTVIYGMGESYAGNITREDLNTSSPYNTYRISGLPPTPIALPGEESIKASLNPMESDYLYFVATGDGGHHFSATLEEHNAAVARYQLNQSEPAGTQ